MERHGQLVEASTELVRTLFKIRAKLSTDDEGALKAIYRFGPVGRARTLRKLYEGDGLHPKVVTSFDDSLRTIQEAWPLLTVLECIDVAKTVTQAASLALVMAIRDGKQTHECRSDEGVQARLDRQREHKELADESR
jgi:hypothetical protein